MKSIYKIYTLFLVPILWFCYQEVIAQDLDKNWIQKRYYDLNNNLVSESKTFYDKDGRETQLQTKNLSANKVLVSEKKYTEIGFLKSVSLTASLNQSDFLYNNGFFEVNYFSPVPNSTVGTLGWYYSNNNNMEPYVGITGYPYSRYTYHNNASPGIRATTIPGDALREGQGHEISSFSVPVLNELNFYIQVRNKFFSQEKMGMTPADIKNKVSQRVDVDANGKPVMNIVDIDGRVLLSAGEGNDLVVTNDVEVSDQPFFFLFPGNSCTFPDYNEITDIYGVFLFNMSADDYSSLDDGNPILETGYYRFEMGDSKFRYINHYGNISFNFYNQLGQLVASIAPEGVKKLIENFHIYTNLSDIPFVNTYEYDQLGRLIAATSPDQGRSEYVYRIDGILRFSQNEEQKLTGKFSYTNYDLFNRPIESGEYLPGNMSFEQVKTNSAIQEDRTASGGLTGGAKTSWVRTHYDDSDNSHGKAGYIQNDLYLRDAVSWTENENAKTWYNYDEEGRVVWTITDISGLGPKTVDYSYNALGAVSKVDYQKDIAAERFVHEYEYDADGRLKRAYTALSQQNRKEQAHYHYYIHGPLKRVELAGNLQGIDYTYTPQGLLKTINHSDIANDPGKDGIQNGFAPDAFGMTLEYFPTDYTRAGTNIVSLNTGTTYNHYNGNISGQSWFSQKPETVTAIYGTGVNSPSMFTYEYDNKYQFLNNKFGAPNFLSAGFNEQANKNREYNLSYDRNGNIQALRRNDRNGNLKDDFVYHYQEGTNKLQAVDNYASYTYDKLGQLTGQTKLDVSGQSISIGYDVSGKVIAIYAGSGITEVISLDGDNSLSDGQQSVVTATQEIILKPGFEASVGSTFHAMIQSTDTIYSYAYDERGNRIKKRDHIQNYTTYYVYDASGNVMAIYDDKGTALQQKEVPVYAAGRIGMYNRVNSTYQYELTDHLGNVRVVLNQNKTPQGLADVVYYSDYYPYGMPMGLASNDYRYGYQGQYAEADKETAWNAFTLRNYDAAIGRWLSTDPYGQYASPYVGMGNNPVRRVDQDGGVDDDFKLTSNGVELIRQTNDPNHRIFDEQGKLLFTITSDPSFTRDMIAASGRSNELSFKMAEFATYYKYQYGLANYMESRAKVVGWDFSRSSLSLMELGTRNRQIIDLDNVMSFVPGSKYWPDNNMRQGKPKDILSIIPKIEKIDQIYSLFTHGRSLQSDAMDLLKNSINKGIDNMTSSYHRVLTEIRRTQDPRSYYGFYR